MLKILCELGDLCEGSSTLLEKQVPERKEQSEQLSQAVLREAFEGGK